MAATAQANLDALQTQIEGDATLTAAQKAQAQGLLYALSRALFGNASNPPKNGYPA